MIQDIEMVGHVFGKLTVVKRSHQNHESRWFWLCKCSCGNYVTRSKKSLNPKTQSSCGCSMNEYKKTHGMRNTKEYSTWTGIKNRCLNTNSKDRKNYSQRGINISKDWEISFVNFFKDMGKAPTSNHQIERVDNNIGYNKDNCIWATAKENSLNKRTSFFWFIRGFFFESATDAGSFFGVAGITIHRWCGAVCGSKKKKDCIRVRRYRNDSC